MKYVKIWLECDDPTKYEEHYLEITDEMGFNEIEAEAADWFEEYRNFYLSCYADCRYGWKYITKEEYDNV